jgi:hypothetical protein
LPWGSFAEFFFERGLTGPNVLHLSAPVAARFALPAIVCFAVYFFLDGKRGEKIFLEGNREKRRSGNGRWRAALAFVCGAAAYAALGILLPRQISFLSPSLVLQRAYIADVYFDQRGTLEEEIARTGSPQPRLLARRERELALPPPPWPFRPASR